jgi:RNA polymerase subunit RPABC4/transcription elongation factor Spt4
MSPSKDARPRVPTVPAIPLPPPKPSSPRSAREANSSFTARQGVTRHHFDPDMVTHPSVLCFSPNQAASTPSPTGIHSSPTVIRGNRNVGASTPPISSHRVRGSNPPPCLSSTATPRPHTNGNYVDQVSGPMHSTMNPVARISPNPPSISPVPTVAPMEDTEALECVICLMEFNAQNRMASTLCACGLNMALFHKSCLRQYLTQRSTCPNCCAPLVVLESDITNISSNSSASTCTSEHASTASIVEEAPLECVICLMEFDTENRMASTQCACGLNMALFHKHCLRQYLTQKKTCPNCDQTLIILESL